MNSIIEKIIKGVTKDKTGTRVNIWKITMKRILKELKLKRIEHT